MTPLKSRALSAGRDSKAVMLWIANPVSPVRLRIAPPTSLLS